MNDKRYRVLMWIVRVLALVMLLFGLPFYFGYGNPLPFTNPDYTLWDNIWLTVFPLVFSGLVLGWFFPRAGGYMIVISVVIGLVVGIAMRIGFPSVMLAPLLLGIAYIVLGYLGSKKTSRS